MNRTIIHRLPADAAAVRRANFAMRQRQLLNAVAELRKKPPPIKK